MGAFINGRGNGEEVPPCREQGLYTFPPGVIQALVSLDREKEGKSLFHFSYCNNNSLSLRSQVQDSIMNDRQRFIDYASLIPVIGILVLIETANDQFVTMVTAYVLCGELFCILVSRILQVCHIDMVLLWLGGIMLWLWYWFWLGSSHDVVETVRMAVG